MPVPAFSLDSSNHDVMLAEAWNGTKWVIQHTTTPLGATSAVFRGVSCNTSACTAVGDYIGSSAFVTLAETWNGTKWVIQKTSNPSGPTIGSFLTSVSCTSSTVCTAVGFADTSAPGAVTVAEAWNGGTKWVIQPTSNPSGAQQSYMNGVSCTSAKVCNAVGYANIGATAEALAETHS